MNIVVESAIKLDTSTQQQLQKQLSGLSKSKLSFTYKTEPNLVGGLRITTPSKVVDLSLAAKLNQLRNTLLTNYDDSK